VWAALTVLGLAACLTAGESLWTDDFEAAKAQAEKDGKDLLLDFTGSDWCGWCVKLRKEVFDQEEFKKEAPKHFVLVELDFPRKKELAAKVKEQNRKLAEHFGVQGYPTIFLTDAKGRTYARTGYQEGGAQKYLEHLAELRGKKATRDELFAKAEKAAGVEKAKLLDKAVEQLAQEEALAGYDDLIQQIIDLDPENQAGLKSKYERGRKLADISKTADGGDMDGALAKTDAFLKTSDLPVEAKQQALYLKALILNSKRDRAGTMAALEAARDADAKSELGKQLAGTIEQMKKAAEEAKKEPPAEEKK
jgi:thioredoxin-related protein